MCLANGTLERSDFALTNQFFTYTELRARLAKTLQRKIPKATLSRWVRLAGIEKTPCGYTDRHFYKLVFLAKALKATHDAEYSVSEMYRYFGEEPPKETTHHDYDQRQTRTQAPESSAGQGDPFAGLY